MYSIATLLFLAFVTSTVTDHDIENGIYEVVGEQEAKITMLDSGRKVHLGQKLNYQSVRNSIWSENNNNDQFGFCVKGCEFDRLPKSTLFAVVAEGRCFTLSGGKNSNDDRVSFDLWGRAPSTKDAKRLSDFLKTKVELSQHPGHQIRTRLLPTKKTYTAGQSIPVEIEITNVGEVPIYFMNGGQQRGPRNNQFRFIAFSANHNGKAVPDVGDPTNFGGLAAFVTLKPGETFKRTADLANWFKIETADTLYVTGIF